MNAGFLLFALLAFSLELSLSEELAAPQKRIAFVRDSSLWIANLDGSKTRKLVRGDNPSISPDGTKVAFTMSPEGGTQIVRYIAVTQVATGATSIFKKMPSNNCFGPVWSPDGSQIVFEIFVENHWRLGLVNADGDNFRFFPIPARDSGWYSPSWARDSKSIFCQDLEKICQFSLDGGTMASWEIGKIIPKSDMDSSKRLSVCQDGKKLLVDVNMDEDESLKDWEGPPPAIWLFDIPSGTATRLTPKKSYASDSCWLNDSAFLLVDADKDVKKSSI